MPNGSSAAWITRPAGFKSSATASPSSCADGKPSGEKGETAGGGRGRLTVLEPAIQVLDPAETGLVPDTSAQFTDSILYMESQLRQAVPSDDRIHVGHTEEIVNAKLNDEVRALDEFKARQLRQLELDLSQSRQSEQFKRHRDEQARQDIQDIHDEYVIWIEETMTTEPHPWIRVICAMTPLAQ